MYVRHTYITYRTMRSCTYLVRCQPECLSSGGHRGPTRLAPSPEHAAGTYTNNHQQKDSPAASDNADENILLRRIFCTTDLVHGMTWLALNAAGDVEAYLAMRQRRVARCACEQGRSRRCDHDCSRYQNRCLLRRGIGGRFTAIDGTQCIPSIALIA